MAEQRLDLDGPVAPPRRNGELVFAEPWESRVFGLTMALHQAGIFIWDEFRSRLIDAIHHAAMFMSTASGLTHKADRVRIVDHDHRVVLIGQIADLLELRDVTVH